MKKNYDISVIVLTYESKLIDIFNTLHSIIIQKDIEFEIIIADDGSRNFDNEVIEKYLKDNNFYNYCILNNKINRGTVLNLLNATYIASSKYIKPISPGDFLYSSNTLKDCYDYLEKNDYKLIFGKAVYYTLENYEVSIYNRSNPQNLGLYLNRKNKQILKEYLYYQDYVLGAAVICEKNIMVEYLEKIKGQIVYLEDLAYALMIVDGINMYMFDNYIIWYECKGGISNKKDSPFKDRCIMDMSNCNKIISQKYPKLKKYCKFHFYEHYNKNLFFRIKRKIRKIILTQLRKYTNNVKSDVRILSNIIDKEIKSTKYI